MVFICVVVAIPGLACYPLDEDKLPECEYFHTPAEIADKRMFWISGALGVVLLLGWAAYALRALLRTRARVGAALGEEKRWVCYRFFQQQQHEQRPKSFEEHFRDM